MWITNSFTSSYEVIVSTVETNMAYLESQLTIIRIVLQLDKEESFLIKSMKIKFQGHLEIESCFSVP